jgi:phenylalanyl-tRNA synthetase beta chain
VAVALSGNRDRSGWWGSGRAVTWGDAVDAAHLVAESYGAQLEVTADEHAPWHPGRCAALSVAGEVVGHAGELHPQVVTSLGLPARTCAMELELDLISPSAEDPTSAPHFSTFPVAKEDLALVVDAEVPAAQVADALSRGGGHLVEGVRLFDIYTGDQVEAGKKSLAFALRLRATDHTLTPEEVAHAREAALHEAGRSTGATLRE